MKVTRWPALIVFIALIFGGFFANSTRGANEEAASLERVITSAVGSESDLVSIWYCVSGTVGGAGIADHQVILGNKSDNNADVVITVVPVLAPLINAPRDGEERKKVAPETIQIETDKTSVEVPPRSVKTITVADLPKVAGEFAAVIIESNVGDLVVDHRVRPLLLVPVVLGQGGVTQRRATWPKLYFRRSKRTDWTKKVWGGGSTWRLVLRA